MSNSEENQNSEGTNQKAQQGTEQENSTHKSNQPVSSSKESRSDHAGESERNIQDPEHNTGKKHMRIDEEGAEIGPNDEI